MNTSALFYPYINLPESSWLSQQLLYHDRIGSIVPSEFIYNPELLTPYMRDLVSTELVYQVVPARYLYFEDDFNEAFLSLVNRHGIIRNLRQPQRIRPEYIEIHLEKFGETLKQELRDLGLLFEKDHTWCIVEKNTGILLMAYVSKILGMNEELNMTPITNNPDFLKPFQTKAFNNPMLAQEETVILNKLFPIPKRPIPVQELVKFKEKHTTLLFQFRDEIFCRITKISNLSDINTKKFELSELARNLNEKAGEITRRLEEQKWGEINFGTLCGLTSAIIPVIDATTSGDVTELYKAIPGLAAAVLSVLKPNKEKIQKIKDEPMAYASYVKKTFYK